jgi:hypothetical protein
MIILLDEQEKKLLNNIQAAIVDIQTRGHAYPDAIIALLQNVEQFIKDNSQTSIADQEGTNQSGRSVCLRTDDNPHVRMEDTLFYTETIQEALTLYHALMTVVEVEDDD